MNKTYMLKFTIYSLLSLCIIIANNTLNLKYLAISLFIGFFASILNEILTELRKLNKTKK